jgi:hypothetical protein
LQPKIKKYYKWLRDYFEANIMTNNADKTAVIIVSRRDNDYINDEMVMEMDGFMIKPKAIIKLLGYYLSNDLSHESHITTGSKSLLKKLYYIINVLKRLSHYTDFNKRRMIANAIFNGSLNYLIPLWGSAEDKLILKIQVAQLKAAKLIIGNPCYRLSTSQILNKVNWLSIKQIIIERSVTVIHNIMTIGKPLGMFKMFKTIKRDQRTRAKPKIERIDGFKPRTQFAMDQFYKSALDHYNVIPEEMKILNKKEFKKEIKKNLRLNIPVRGNQFLAEIE